MNVCQNPVNINLSHFALRSSCVERSRVVRRSAPFLPAAASAPFLPAAADADFACLKKTKHMLYATTSEPNGPQV
jgi:hypothetical protein